MKSTYEQKREQIVEAMREADAQAYRFPTMDFTAYVDSDGDVGIEESIHGDNSYSVFEDGYSRNYIHSFNHQHFSVLWDVWYQTAADFAEAFRDRFGVELETERGRSLEEDADATCEANGIGAAELAAWLGECTEEAIRFAQSETDYDEIFDLWFDDQPYMIFTAVDDREYGARNAGYTFDEKAERERDEDLYRELIRERGENWVDRKADALWDLSGGLFLGEDGQPYAVEFVWDHEGYKPLFWHRLRKAKED